MNKKILAIIPARGRSKRLPKKNIRILCGKPLIAWTIEQAKKSNYIDKTIVSTDDEEIAEVSREYGSEVPFLRPKKLAKDDSPTIDAVIHAIKFLKKKGENFDVIVLLEPTSPLRKYGDLDKAIGKFFKNQKISDSLVSVGQVHLEDPNNMKKIVDGYVKPFLENNSLKLQNAFFPYGVIYLSEIDALLKYKSFYQDKTIFYQIERWQNYEIDDIYDFIAIENIMKRKMKYII